MPVSFEPFNLEIDYNGKHYSGKITPFNYTMPGNTVPKQFNVVLNNTFVGSIICSNEGWKGNKEYVEQGLVDAIGDFIVKWYE